jgi:hypothetical protein
VNEKDRAWVDSKFTPQLVGVALQPIKLTGAREKVARKADIRAPTYKQPTFDKAYATTKADKTWRTYVMVDMPERLVELLLEAST